MLPLIWKYSMDHIGNGSCKFNKMERKDWGPAGAVKPVQSRQPQLWIQLAHLISERRPSFSAKDWDTGEGWEEGQARRQEGQLEQMIYLIIFYDDITMIYMILFKISLLAFYPLIYIITKGWFSLHWSIFTDFQKYIFNYLGVRHSLRASQHLIRNFVFAAPP